MNLLPCTKGLIPITNDRTTFYECGFNNLKEIKELIKNEYGIEVRLIRKINRGSANIFKIFTNKDIYILKEYQSKYQEEDIMKEIDLINHLYNKGISVPKYLLTKDNKYCLMNNNHVIIMQYYIDGYTKDKNMGNYQETMDSASLLGSLVKAFEDYEFEGTCIASNWINLDFDKYIIKYKQMKENVLNDSYRKMILKDIDDKIEMLEGMKKRNYSEIDKMTVKLSHGDYSIMQFIYKNRKIHSVIDFASASLMPISWEIIRSYNYIYKNITNDNFCVDVFVDYVKEYMKHSDLNKYDLMYMVDIYLIQLLESQFGYKQYIKNQDLNLLEFGIYRTNMCRLLYKNIDIIKKSLMENIEC